MKLLVRIKEVSNGGMLHRRKKYDVALLTPMGRGHFLAVNKSKRTVAAYQTVIGIRAARKEAKRVAELYNATIEEE